MECANDFSISSDRRCRSCREPLPEDRRYLCATCNASAIAAAAAAEEQRVARAIDAAMVRANLSYDFARGKKSLESFQAENESQRRALAAVRAFLEGDVHSLFLHGDAGTGKSHLAASAVAELVRRHRRARFISARGIAADLRAAMGGAMGGDVRILQDLAAVPVLAIDDLGTSDKSSAFNCESLLMILDERVRHRRRTLLTSNFNLRGLAERLAPTGDAISGGLIADRVRELCDVIEITGPSFRAKEHARAAAAKDDREREDFQHAAELRSQFVL